MILALWLLSFPFRLLAALGLRRCVILACLLVLAVTAYGVAQDLGLLQPPAQAAPAPKPATGQPSRAGPRSPTFPPATCACTAAGARYRIPWPVLAAIGKVESDHGRVRLPGVRSGSNWAGACGPMQLGCVPGARPATPGPAMATAAPMTRPTPSRPRPATWSTTAPAAIWTGRIFAYNHSWSYVARVKQLARRYAAEGVGGGERPDLRPPGPGLGWTGPGVRGRLRDCGTELAREHQPGGGRADRPADPLPGLWHPGRPAAARDHQPGHRPRAGQGPARTLRPPPLAACPPPAPAPDALEGGEFPHARIPDLADRQPGRRSAARVGQDRHPLGQPGPPPHRRTLAAIAATTPS